VFTFRVLEKEEEKEGGNTNSTRHALDKRQRFLFGNNQRRGAISIELLIAWVDHFREGFASSARGETMSPRA